jgi:hypothetical protein
MRILLFTIAFFTFASCQSNQGKNSIPDEDSTMRYSKQEFETLSIELPSTWQRIPDDTLPKTLDMTARYWILTGTRDTIYLIHGFSAGDFSEGDSEHYNRERDTLFGRMAIKFSSKAGANTSIGVFVDSVGQVKPVGHYGFTAYSNGLKSASIDSFRNVIRTIKLHSLE